MKAVILAGGHGTRMASETPKPLLPVFGKPILFRILDLLDKYSLHDVLILTGHESELVERTVRKKYRGSSQMQIAFHRDIGFGTAGAVWEARHLLVEDFLMIYGDLVLDLNLDELLRKHAENRADATLVVHPTDHPFDSDLVEVDHAGHITDICRARGVLIEDLPCRNLAMSAVGVLSPKLLTVLPKMIGADFGRHVYPQAVSRSYRMFAYQTADYCKDCGTPERLREINEDFSKDNVRRRRYPAVFLDRDGVINGTTAENGFVNDPTEFVLLDRVPEAIKMLRSAGYKIVVVTNQGGISLGYMTDAGLNQIHVRMDSLLAAHGAYVDRVYHCPHYKDLCDCRKPAIGMVERARIEMNLDLSRSYFVGDRTSDIECARRARVKSFGVLTGSACRDEEFHRDPTEGMVDTLFHAAKAITQDPT